jgi:glutamine amidotransferase
VIVVVDYGVNNLTSVVRALAAGGHAATLTTDPDTVRAADHLVVPGVGNFGQASRTMEKTGLGAAIREAAAAGRPVMGICLGLQLFFASSEEAPEARGLAILPGRVQRFVTTLHVPTRLGRSSCPAGHRHPCWRRLPGRPQFFITSTVSIQAT